jgi:methyl-accepting chemotaxis protein
MRILHDIKISAKIVGLLAMLGTLCLGIAMYGNTTLTRSDAAYSTLVNNHLTSAVKLARTHRLSTSMLASGFSLLVPGRDLTAAEQQESENFKKAQVLLAEVKSLRPEIEAKVGDVSLLVGQVHEATGIAIKHAKRGDVGNARAAIDTAEAAYDKMAGILVPLNNGTIAESARMSEELSTNAATTSKATLVISLIGIAAAIGFGLVVTRAGITGPISQLRDTMRALAAGNTDVEVQGTEWRDEIGAMSRSVLTFREAAVAQKQAAVEKMVADAAQQLVVNELTTGLAKLSQGDLTAQINAALAPEYAELKSNFNGAVNSLNSTIGAVTTSAASIRMASVEIAQASEDLARRTESNAASLEQTSAALTEIDGRLKDSAKASERTVGRADEAIQTVQNGRSMAVEAVAAMGRVSDSAKGIDNVIEGLDKIAFQTRVLAMNAAVEAGRAGDAGRGFAVVADLVSALAMRAEEEAKRARDQLTVTQTDVVSAVGAVQKVDAALTSITENVDEVHVLLRGMASGNETQATAIGQITEAIGSMDKSTQQNAAMVEQTSAAARNLATEISELSERAGQFKTEDSAPSRMAIKPRSAVQAPRPVARKTPTMPIGAMAGAGAAAEWSHF